MSERIEVIVGQVESIAFKRSDDIEQIAGDEQGYAVMEEGFPRSGQSVVVFAQRSDEKRRRHHSERSAFHAQEFIVARRIVDAIVSVSAPYRRD